MKPFHANRLVKLAQHLATIPEQYFDLSSWAEGEIDDQSYLKQAGLKEQDEQTCSAQQLIDVNCGTTACALGWAATIPAFRKAGLKLVVDVSTHYPDPFWDEDEDEDEDEIDRETGLTAGKSYRLIGDVYYKPNSDCMPYSGISAGAAFFGITYEQSQYLFLTSFYFKEMETGSISDVIQHIVDVLWDNEYGAQASIVASLEV